MHLNKYKLYHIMKTFSINTLGCKVNQYESQQIRQFLEGLGLDQVGVSAKPDIVVINTCCVTGAASAKSRQRIRKAQKLSPNAAIVVSGCLPTVQIGELDGLDKNICLVRRRETIAAVLGEIVNSKAESLDSQSLQACQNSAINAEKGFEQPKLTQLTSFKGHTRAFLKVQDGCDGYCSYCIIPKTRPFVHSKPVETAMQEAEALVAAGHKEIVVTGVFLGAYGQKSVGRKNGCQPKNDRLADLLDKMAEIRKLSRIRLSSLEPADVTPRLLDAFRRHPNIMPHLHLSLQSGSDAVLKGMGRQYRTDEFVRTVEAIKSRLDRPAITVDIIVGFPGETDTDFEQTVGLAKEIGFAKMHIFRFSPRKGTAAANMQGVVDNRVIKNRSKILHELDIELGRKFRQQFIGETAVILLENNTGHSTTLRTSQSCGRSERYFMVYLNEKTENLKKNELVRVKLVENGENGAIGQVL